MTPTARPSDADVREMARGLSEAAKWAMSRGPIGYIARSTGAACRASLQRKGLVLDRMYAESLTPLGLEVQAALRRHLMEKDNG